MRITHWFSYRPLEFDALLFALGFDTDMNMLSISEDDPQWSNIGPAVERLRVPSLRETSFTTSERLEAAFLNMRHTTYNDLTMLDTWYRDATFDLSNYCSNCGVGAKQWAPFQIEREPQWGKKGIMQLGQIRDAFFTTPEIWDSVFSPLGISCLPVVKERSGEGLKTIVQLLLEDGVDLDMGDRNSIDCRVCGRRKYVQLGPGPHPRPVDPKAHAFTSNQYIVADAGASRVAVVSNELYRRISRHKVRGVAFLPCSQ